MDVGDPTNGLRRSLGVNGRLPLSLDETVTPVVLVRDIRLPPYASEPRRCFGSTSSVGTVAKAPASTILNNAAFHTPDSPGIVAVVNSARVNFGLFQGGAGFNTKRFIVFALSRNVKPTDLGVVAVSASRIVSNDDNANATAVVTPAIPQVQLYTDPTAAIVGQTFIVTEVTAINNTANFPPPSDVVFTFGPGIVLYDGSAIQVGDGQAIDNGQVMEVSWQWDEYQIVRP